MKMVRVKAVCLAAVFSNAMVAKGDDIYKYAPRQKPLQGTPLLNCIGIKYQDMDRYTSASECSSIARQVSSFYRINSRGLLNMQTKGYMERVPFNGNRKNLNNAEAFSMRQHPGADYYAIVGIFTVNHAGGKVAHLSGGLIRTAQHEVGHLLGLGHTGAYSFDKNGKSSLDQYGDGQSVMGKYPSSTLTAPQYYAMGWLRQDEAAIWEEGKSYDLRRINDWNGDGLATVIVPASKFNRPSSNGDELDEPGDTTDPAGKTRDAYVSFPPGCNACMVLHLANGASSQRVKIFGKEYYDTNFTGLHYKLEDAASGKIRITIDEETKPADFVDAASVVSEEVAAIETSVN